MTRVPFLDLGRETAELGAELEEAVAAVVRGGRYVGGPEVEAFEAELAAACGVAHAVGVNSGTDALELALRAAGVGPGDEVVTAANTCVPTVAAIEAAGATPVLADADPASRTLDPEAAAAACGPRTRALVPVHLYGQCADMERLLELARERSLVVVEDAAQAHNAAYRGRPAGSLGHAGAFSFYPTKNLGALGDAGAVVTDDDELAHRVRLLRNYGERERYDSVLRGRNSRLDPLQAAALRVKLRRLDGWTERRRELAARYLEALAPLGDALPREQPGRRHSYHLFVLRLERRDEVRAALAAAGVETLVHYPRPVHEHPAYRELGYARLERSERLSREVLSLPLYPQLRDDEADAVVEAVLEAVRR